MLLVCIFLILHTSERILSLWWTEHFVFSGEPLAPTSTYPVVFSGVPPSWASLAPTFFPVLGPCMSFGNIRAGWGLRVCI